MLLALFPNTTTTMYADVVDNGRSSDLITHCHVQGYIRLKSDFFKEKNVEKQGYGAAAAYGKFMPDQQYLAKFSAIQAQHLAGTQYQCHEHQQLVNKQQHIYPFIYPSTQQRAFYHHQQHEQRRHHHHQ
uniref:Uncharacterized protein n=1 Tax=Glossina pallidipes TaxID=7398 RepID=A0A1A9ZIJ7_GLOPL